MAMTLTVRRRAVCALALLALLCGGCCGATGVGAGAPATPSVSVAVEVSCPNGAKKLSWRFSGKSGSDWTPCPNTPEVVAGSSGTDHLTNALCVYAGSWYLSTGAGTSCPTPSTGDTQKVAFAMKCATAEGSVLHKRSKGETGPSDAPEKNTLGEPGVCELLPPTAGGGEGAPERQPQLQPPTGPQAGRAPGAPAAPPTTTAENREADAPGSTQTPSTPQGPSGTPNSAPSAGGNDGTTTTTTTTSSPSAGNTRKSNADSSGTIATVWARAPLLLLLLLTAAFASAAG
ncbi:mucin-like glycoprotein [Trypanosoma conorhini]|uniref:Mucin-like glycoprotein n=1 Tax=Trypanosoma conorhini TaxID=83891 RepID=A0A3R7KK41_9TRYP|nr:mucin-like glycoprotein [Trypanosoma conorhini]RNE96036.1 mucin-like glycoprotein [Trypanosoma conorhini]